jgi:MFS family permease
MTPPTEPRRSDLSRALRGNVFLLGLVSLFTDMSSEMVYPLLPVFLTGFVSSSAAAVYIGLMDGLAESTSSILKIYAGRLSDRLGSRKPLALAGYAISSLARPLVALAAAGWHVVALRVIDRIGKGLRTSPRDALLSESADYDVRGVAFSFHRMMDHIGAVLGPLAAAVFLYLVLGQGLIWQRGNGVVSAEEMRALRWLFACALAPGLAATLVLWWWVRETPSKTNPPDSGALEKPLRAPALPPRFFVFLGAVTLFTLGNSSDLFLIFYTQTRFGLGLGWAIALWVMLHLSKIIFSLPGGRLSDRAGRRPAIITGWVIYIAVYLAMPFVSELRTACLLLLVYGSYYGMTEGAERAMVADFVPAPLRGKAYGLYHAAVGLAALPASFLFGVFWATLGPRAAFLIGASLAAAGLLILVWHVSVGGKTTAATDTDPEPGGHSNQG